MKCHFGGLGISKEIELKMENIRISEYFQKVEVVTGQIYIHVQREGSAISEKNLKFIKLLLGIFLVNF